MKEKTNQSYRNKCDPPVQNQLEVARKCLFKDALNTYHLRHHTYGKGPLG